MTAHAFWIIRPGQGELRPEDLPAPGPAEHRLRMLASGVSRGTEALVFAGRVPPSQYQTLRAPRMAGDFPFPVKYGYCCCRDDRARPAGSSFCITASGPLQRAGRRCASRSPDAVPTQRAVLAANMETALNLLWDAAPLPGERMLVVGAGVLGLLTAALLARIPAARVTVVDLDPARATIAREFGCAFATPDTAPAEQELIVHCSASESGLRLCLASAAFEARIIEASWYADAAPTIPLGEAFHASRLRLIASQVGAIAPIMRGRRTHAERLATALSLLNDANFDALLQGPTRFEDLPAAMPSILRPGGLCHVITYGDA